MGKRKGKLIGEHGGKGKGEGKEEGKGKGMGMVKEEG